MSSVNRFAVGGCQCTSACDVPFVVTGCGDASLPGATVSVWTDNTKGTLIATGTTDALGHLTLDLGTSGTYYREVSHPRLATVSATSAYTCGSGVNVALTTVAAGYHCLSGCGVPLPETLSATTTSFGSFTLTWGGGSGTWTYTLIYSYPGCYGCAADTTSLEFILVQADGRMQIQYNQSGGCPNEWYGSPYSIPYDQNVTHNCPPAFLWEGAFIPAAGLPSAALVCQTGTPEYLTVTE